MKSPISPMRRSGKSEMTFALLMVELEQIANPETEQNTVCDYAPGGDVATIILNGGDK